MATQTERQVPAMRAIDRVLVGWYMFALVFALLMDPVNALVAWGKPIDEAALEALWWPPAPVKRVFMWW